MYWYWLQEAQVKTQQNSFLSIIQMQDNGCLANDVDKQHRWKQMIMTPEKGSAQPMTKARVCGKLNTIKEDL